MPDWLRTRLRIRKLRRNIRELENHFEPLAADAKGDHEQAILTEWSFEARWPESELAQHESVKLRKLARRWNVDTPSSEQDHQTGRTLHTSFVERLNLTIRHGSAYLRRRSPCHARGADQLHGHVDLLRCHYNFIRPHRALKCGRETRTPAMHAGLVNAPMNWSDIFTAPAALYAFHVAVVRVPVAVQLMHTSPAALSSFSWPHEHRSAA